ncbi:MAG: glycosyltransferase family 39 protein [Thermoleophilia bacterium]|nr:glycosyltransferase family 39 protein [Thermoleophilia bacterium]
MYTRHGRRRTFVASQTAQRREDASDAFGDVPIEHLTGTPDLSSPPEPVTDATGAHGRGGGAPARRPAVGRQRTSRRLVLVAVVAVLLVSAGLRLYNLGSPPEHMFDEVYYAKDARAIIDGRMEGKPDSSWEPGDVVSWPHPDAGKMAIALGILVAGDDPVGWRLPAVVAGLVLLATVYPLARRLGLSPGWAFVALLLASADLLGIAQSRIATLDIFVATWTALSVLFALKYVQRGDAARWLVLSGLCGGLAVATKWSGALALVAALLVVLLGRRLRSLGPERAEGGGEARADGESKRRAGGGGEQRTDVRADFVGGQRADTHADARTGRVHEDDRRTAGEDGGAAPVDERGGDRDGEPGGHGRPADGRTPDGPTAEGTEGAGPTAAREPARAPAGRRPAGGARTAAQIAACLVALPLAVYLASYTAYFANGHTLADFRELHSQMLHFNLTLSAEHSYASIAPTWILDYRPVWYSFREIAARFYGVVAIGNPLLWWTSLLCLVAAAVLALRRRSVTPALAALLVVVLYLPWFATTRTSFLYYMTPVAPFLAILVAAVAAELVDGRRRRSGRTPTGGAVDATAALPLPARIAAVLAAALVAAFLWYPLGRLAELLFWELPGRVADALAWVAAGVGVALAVTAALVALNSPRLRPWVVLLLLGAIVGIAVPFLPIVLDVAISKEDFYRLMWFPSWI